MSENVPANSNDETHEHNYVDKETFKKLFNSEYVSDSDSEDRAEVNDMAFSSEEYQYQRYLTTPGFKFRWLTRDLELSYLRNPAEVSQYSDLIGFTEEIYSVGAKKTSLWFALQIFSQLNLRVSIDGFGRKEANPRRSKSEVVQREESGGGWLSKLGKNK